MVMIPQAGGFYGQSDSSTICSFYEMHVGNFTKRSGIEVYYFTRTVLGQVSYQNMKKVRRVKRLGYTKTEYIAYSTELDIRCKFSSQKTANDVYHSRD